MSDALQVEHLDLMPILDPSLATFYDGLHLTPEGARAVAAAVVAAIVGRPLPQAVRADAEMSALLR